jgi:hypothetical protein
MDPTTLTPQELRDEIARAEERLARGWSIPDRQHAIIEAAQAELDKLGETV